VGRDPADGLLWWDERVLFECSLGYCGIAAVCRSSMMSGMKEEEG
jgi:hypothetical protein